MQKNDLEYVVSMLKDMNIQAVANSTGLSYRTVWAIANGRHTTPSYNTVRTLTDYFRSKA